VHRLPLLAENDFFPDLDSIPADVAKRAKLLVINYPNSPTGKVATRDFYRRVVDFAQRHQVIVIQDAAHIMLSYQGAPLSFLQTPGARDVGVEVHSMSKGFHMIGWRLGWVCGHERIVRAFADVKDNSDSGQFIAIQKAAAAALDDTSIPQQVRQKYERRLRKLVETLTRCGFACSLPGGTYFLYTKSPQGLASGERFENAEAASQYLITQHSIVTVPWDDAGAFLRFSVTYEAADEKAEDALMAETEMRMKQIRPVF
jgi:LL-diaminopimelate aminotransferase